MAKRGRPPKKKITELYLQYDMDRIVGEEWKTRFDEILNKRHADGWKYVPPYFRIGISEKYNSQLSQPEIVYGVLYERIEQPMEKNKFQLGE